ncbi:MAG TPA: type II toxin-antitoxin system VapC family toxin [Dehalococcoidia bacterium]|nr:type II toxin-antitoxin system VapC family toxin [Dehalococcoidia bacterium]
MLLLDTDHLSLLDADAPEGVALGMRLAEAARTGEQVAVTIITYEEQMRGWLAYLAKANSQAKQVQAYSKLRRHVESFREIPLVDYDANAARTFEQLRRQGVRIGSMDLKIASIALSLDALLLSRNLRDFNTVPGLRVADWCGSR